MRSHFLRAAAGTKIFKFIGSTSTTTSASSYTFSSVNLGDASPRRTIFVSIAGVQSSVTTASISSVTIGGSSATINVAASALSSLGFAFINNNTLTSGDVVVNFSATRDRGCAIAVYNLISLSTSIKSSSHPAGAAGVTSRVTGSLSVVPDGYVMAVLSKGSSQAVTWTNASQNASHALGGTTNIYFASGQTTTTNSAYTITASWTTSADARISGASWE